jgi:hypothetical protein
VSEGKFPTFGLKVCGDCGGTIDIVPHTCVGKDHVDRFQALGRHIEAGIEEHLGCKLYVHVTMVINPLNGSMAIVGNMEEHHLLRKALLQALDRVQARMDPKRITPKVKRQ